MKRTLSALLAVLSLAAVPARAGNPLSFRSARLYPLLGASQVVAADFNGDGYADLAAIDGSNSISVLLNSGEGVFRLPVTYAAGTTVAALAVGDFNGDGKPDLAVADVDIYCYCPGSLSILLGNGDGTFQPPFTYPAGSGAAAVATGDFNGDGKLDVVLANYGFAGEGQTVSVLLGNGDGTFQPAVDYTVQGSPVSVAVADFNGDGKLDLAVANFSGYGILSILLGNGDGTFQPQIEISVSIDPDAVAAGDLNGDGMPDLIVAGTYVAPGGNTVFVLLGNGDGTFQPPTGYPAEADAFALALADFNRDGHLDVAVADASGGRGNPATPGITILLGKGDGSLEPAGTYVSFGNNQSLAVADFDHDGKLDLATGTGEAVDVLRGNGKGHFQEANSYAAGRYPSSITVADFDQDGALDVAVANNAGASVFKGNGDGTFQPAVSHTVPGGAVFIAGVDLNHDGKPDLAMANYGDSAVTIMLGNGDGTFQAPVTYPVGAGPETLVVGDFNGDHNLDIAVTGFDDPTGTVSLLLGNGDGTFRASSGVPAWNYGRTLDRRWRLQRRREARLSRRQFQSRNRLDSARKRRRHVPSADQHQPQRLVPESGRGGLQP